MSPEKINTDSDETMMVEEEGSTPPKKRWLSPVLLYSAIAVVMIAAGLLVGSHFLMTASDDRDDAREVKARQVEHDEPAELFMISDIIVNPAGTAGTRFLSVSIGFEAYSSKTVTRLESREHLVRDALITILGSKTIQQLSDPKQKEIIRFQIKKRTEQLLRVDDLAAVYFTEFILQ
ncbi:MAG: flagellar basal body-associated FliL family protein [Candidatus Zixiibacteriota bacterium]|nr:MAG: flagellar basal body-associated FliL family protein [candidate division Zixibacteria bacterium]